MSCKSEIITLQEVVKLAVPGNSKSGDPEAKRFLLQQIFGALDISPDIFKTPDDQFSIRQLKGDGDYLPAIDGNEVIIFAQQIEKGLKKWVKQADNESRCRKLAQTLRQNGFDVISDYIDQCVTNNGSDIAAIEIEESIIEEPSSSKPLLDNKNPSDYQFRIGFESKSCYQEARGNFKNIGICKSFRIFLCSVIFCSYILGFASSLLFMYTAGLTNFEKIYVQPKISSNNLLEFGFTTLLPSISEVTKEMSTALTKKQLLVEQCSALINPPNFQSLERTHLHLIAPDWSKPRLDFCEKNKILLLIKDESNYPFPEVNCPENVVALEIMVTIGQSILRKHLSTFCRLEKIYFVGNDACLTESNENTPIKSSLLRELEFEDIGQCGETLMKIIEQTIDVTNVQKIGLKCFQFDPEISKQLNTFIATFPNISTVECFNNDNCMWLDVKLKKGVRYRTGHKAC